MSQQFCPKCQKLVITDKETIDCGFFRVKDIKCRECKQSITREIDDGDKELVFQTDTDGKPQSVQLVKKKKKVVKK